MATTPIPMSRTAHAIRRDTVKSILNKSVVKRLQTQSPSPLFAAQADIWVAIGQARKRRPFRSKTVETYQSQIETHLKPLIGQLPVEVIGNEAVKQVAAKLSEKGLSPATINLNINLIKQIRASVLDQEGAQVYPYTWNADFIDAPILDKDEQKTPIANATAVQGVIFSNCKGIGPLVAVLAGCGLRIAEALALRIGVPDDGKGTVWIPDQAKIIVRMQRDGQKFGPVKTKAGNREVDLSKQLNDYLKLMCQPGPTIMFPKAANTYGPILKKCGIVGGFHSLRRFRVTHLQMAGVPLPLIHFWVGHEDSTVTGLYTKVGSEIEKRKTQADMAGLGFNLPEAP